MNSHDHTPQFSAGQGGNLALVSASQALTMSSREIADLCEKRHPDVRRDIRGMLEQLGEAVSRFAHTYLDAQGKEQEEYRLPKDLTLTLVTGYRVDLRYRVVKRLETLEAVAATLPPEVAEMIERNFGITKMLARKITEMEKSLPLIASEMADRLVTAKLAESAFMLRRGKTAKQVWDRAGLPPRLKGATLWFGHRLAEGGALLEGRADRGDAGIRLFDPDKSETLLRLGLLERAQRYVAERRGQGRMRLVPLGKAD